MSVHYIIDGYNVLYSTNRWDQLPREQRRVQFLHYCDESRIVQSPRNRVTLVLDGFASTLQKIRLNNIRLVFSQEQDADSVIKSLVLDSPNPREVVVITDDKAVRSAIRSSGARALGCHDFWMASQPKISAKSLEKIDPELEHRINQELRGRWKLT